MDGLGVLIGTVQLISSLIVNSYLIVISIVNSYSCFRDADCRVWNLSTAEEPLIGAYPKGRLPQPSPSANFVRQRNCSISYAFSGFVILVWDGILRLWTNGSNNTRREDEQD